MLDPQVLTADQGGETALEEEERLLGHAGGGDDGAETGGEKDWKVAVKVRRFRSSWVAGPLRVQELTMTSWVQRDRPG